LFIQLSIRNWYHCFHPVNFKLENTLGNPEEITTSAGSKRRKLYKPFCAYYIILCEDKLKQNIAE